MSGYIGEPKKMKPTWRPAPNTVFSYQDSFISRKLHSQEINDPTSKRRAVERLADLAANHGSVEAAANLALFVGLDLNDYVLREGVVNRIKQVEGTEEYMNELLEKARLCRENDDLLGYTALAGIVGYFPPELIDNA